MRCGGGAAHDGSLPPPALPTGQRRPRFDKNPNRILFLEWPTRPLALQTVSGPKQARSERTLQRLLDAAEALIKEKGHAAVSIPEIARRAGSSVGGFYARFRDKNELLRALEERHFIELSQRVEALADARRWQNASTAEIVEAAVAELVSITRERRHMIAAFLVRAIEDPVIREGGLRFRRTRRGAHQRAAAAAPRRDEPSRTRRWPSISASRPPSRSCSSTC